MNTKVMKTKLPSRESETRTKQERPKVWTPPSQLDAPPAPDGFKYRWIRAEVLGQADTKNLSANRSSTQGNNFKMRLYYSYSIKVCSI